jgi:hypothetical protein
MRFDRQPAGLDPLVYRRTMARLRLIIVTAGVVLLALVARLIIAGFTLAIGLTGVLMASVLVAALTLRHRVPHHLRPRGRPDAGAVAERTAPAGHHRRGTSG